MITTDVDFTHDVCGDSAFYFRPNDAADAAVKILSVAERPELRRELIIKGRQALAQLPDAARQYAMQVDAIEAVARHHAAGRKD